MNNINYTSLVGQKAYAHTGELLGLISGIEIAKFTPQPYEDYGYDVIVTVSGNKFPLWDIQALDYQMALARDFASINFEGYTPTWTDDEVLDALEDNDYKWDGFELCWYDNIK